MSKPHIHVAVGILIAENHQILLCSRPDDKPWPGWWELPGGKIETGETVLEALKRELHEELGITVNTATPWVRYVHEYPKTIVHLNFCRVTAWEGNPAGLEGQKMAWVHPAQPLPVSPVLPATEPPLRWLQLPERYLITQIEQTSHLPVFLERLEKTLQTAPHLVQFREPRWETTARQNTLEHKALELAFQAVLDTCRRHNTPCLVNSCHPETWWSHADGVHLRSTDAHRRAGYKLALSNKLRYTALSAHNEADLAIAAQLQTDFITLGHVLPTPSHPDTPPLGWTHFAELALAAGRPVYALGGQSKATLATAQQHGAHGIAGIRQLLTDHA